MKNLIIIFIASTSIWASSCLKETNNENRDGCFEVELNDSVNHKIDSKWIFLGFLHPDTRTEDCKPDNLKEMSIDFQESNRFHVVSSCNSFDGYYSVAAPDSIVIDSIFTTLMYCMNDTVREWEDRYYHELKNATNYQISGNQLSIETKSDIIIILKAD